MKKYKYISILFLGAFFFTSCEADRIPKPINEEEVITTMTLNLIDESTKEMVTLTSQDLDSDGPDKPVISVSGPLKANTVYKGETILLNETVFPAENIIEEVKDEGVDHQFFYEFSSGLSASVQYDDQDENGDPIGVSFLLETGSAGMGLLTATLRHKPDKSAAGVVDGNIQNAGGETDFAQVFDIVIE
ncbi:MAG: type 1 periplasmic binding fold superfamily protein [Leeuwenhoekiella sp.]